MLQPNDTLSERSLYFQGKFREYQVLFSALCQGYFLVECAWCKRRLRWKRKLAAVPDDTSHGICLPCAARLLKQPPTAHPATPQRRIHAQREMDASKLAAPAACTRTI